MFNNEHNNDDIPSALNRTSDGNSRGLHWRKTITDMRSLEPVKDKIDHFAKKDTNL